MSDDSELLAHYATHGDNAAFAALVQRHLGLVYSVALRQTHGNRSLAEDISQQVFTDLAKKAGKLTEHSSLLGWLHTATRFAAIKTIRADLRRLARETEAHQMHELERGTGDLARPQRPVEPLLDDILAGLKERDREALLLRFHGGCSYAEVGLRLALSETAARSCVERALERLRAAYASRGIRSTGAALMAAMAAEASAAAPTGLAATVTQAALASGSAVGIPALAFASFAMNRTATVICTGILAALIVTVAIQTRTHAQLTKEIMSMRAATADVPSPSALATETGEAEVQALKMRRDQLRSGLAGMENKKPASSTMKKQSDWKNVGFSTPEDAFETLAWAVFNNDWDTIWAANEFQPQGKEKLEAFFTSLPDDVRAKYGNPASLFGPLLRELGPTSNLVSLTATRPRWDGKLAYRVVGQKPLSENAVFLRLLVNYQKPSPEGNESVLLIKTDRGWGCGYWHADVANSLISLIDPATGAVRPHTLRDFGKLSRSFKKSEGTPTP